DLYQCAASCTSEELDAVSPIFETLQHPSFVLQLLNNLFGDFRRRALDLLRFFGLLWNVELLNFLQIFAEGIFDFREGNFPQRLVLGLLDADQRGVAQLVNARLDGENCWQRHVDVLEVPGFKLTLYADGGVFLLDVHDDGGMRHAEQFGQDDAGLGEAVVVGLKAGEDQVEGLVFDRGGEGLSGVKGVEADEGGIFEVNGTVGTLGEGFAQDLLGASGAGG